MDKERKKFEKFMMWSVSPDDLQVETSWPLQGEYTNTLVNTMWLGWKARAAVDAVREGGCGFPYCGGNSPECNSCSQQ